MDDTDRALIVLLRDNARLPVATLAQLLRLSRGTVQMRLQRLQDRGDILGYTVRLPMGSEAHRVRAITSIEVAGERSAGVIKALRALPEVRAIHTTNGRWDLVVELDTDSLAAFDAALQRLRLVRGIANTETSLLLSSHQI